MADCDAPDAVTPFVSAEVALDMAETSSYGGLEVSQDEEVGWVALEQGTQSVLSLTGPLALSA